ncbi:MAG: aldehyde dehydrogenase family protein [Bacteroidales bacterium]
MPSEVKEPKSQTKITYATMSAEQMDDLHREFDDAAAKVQAQFGDTHPMFINGRAVSVPSQFEDRSPVDTRVLLGRFQKGGCEQARQAIAAARAAFAMWSRVPWEERVDQVRRIEQIIRDHRAELGALIGWEAGKNRLESIGEVEEAADFFEYYSEQMEQHDGYLRPMGSPGSREESHSVLRPWGVFAIIAPFNFPVALAAGPAAAAMLAGNTVVFKPATDTPYSGLKLYEMIAKAMPPGVFNFVTGGGGTVGQELIDNPGVDGIVFTGSKEVGMRLMRDNSARPIPRPVIIEMGGKNPALVMPTADLEKATDGVMRSSFGAQGQKCSACSRVYVARDVRQKFVEMLVEKTKKIRIGNPLQRDVWMGPVINEGAVETYLRAIEQAKKDGGQVLVGGRRMTGEPYDHGYFVEPTVVDGLPADHPLFTDELFVPITVVSPVLSLDEAIELANRTEYGLTAGIFSEDEHEIQEFFDRIEAGVVYANRRGGATTGAWPGLNSFGGWKASGSTGRGTGGPHYLQQFFREQSRTRAR